MRRCTGLVRRRLRRGGRTPLYGLARRRGLRRGRLAALYNPLFCDFSLVPPTRGARRIARRCFVLSNQPCELDQRVRSRLPCRRRSSRALCSRDRRCRIRAYATISVVRHAYPYTVSGVPLSCRVRIDRSSTMGVRVRPRRSAQAYHIADGAPTPSSPSPTERTVAMPSTNARRAKVISLSSCIIKRNCGRSCCLGSNGHGTRSPIRADRRRRGAAHAPPPPLR